MNTLPTARWPNRSTVSHWGVSYRTKTSFARPPPLGAARGTPSEAWIGEGEGKRTSEDELGCKHWPVEATASFFGSPLSFLSTSLSTLCGSLVATASGVPPYSGRYHSLAFTCSVLGSK